MRLFIFEHLCAGGHAGSPTLRREGWAMLAALAEDFGRVPDVEVCTLLDCDAPTIVGDNCHRVAGDDEPIMFREITAASDAVLVIAPECDGILEERSRWVLETDKTLLGSQPGAITLTADKARLANHFATHKVATPALQSLEDPHNFPAVLKPTNGAGSQATFLIRQHGQLSSALDQAHHEWPGSLLLQTYHPGQPASVTFLIGRGGIVPLPAATQDLSRDGRFRYQGGMLPLTEALAERATALAMRAVKCIPGLAGFVGVDLVLAEDHNQDVVIEINPRPTTSYIGLRRLSRVNLAAALLDVWAGRLPELAWFAGPVHFSPDDDTTYNSRQKE